MHKLHEQFRTTKMPATVVQRSRKLRAMLAALAVLECQRPDASNNAPTSRSCLLSQLNLVRKEQSMLQVHLHRPSESIFDLTDPHLSQNHLVQSAPASPDSSAVRIAMHCLVLRARAYMCDLRQTSIVSWDELALERISDLDAEAAYLQAELGCV